MVERIPGVTDVDVRDDDMLYIAANTIDNRLDDILGVRPVRAVARVLTTVAPANAIHNVTKLDKPSTAIERLMDNAEDGIRSKTLTGRLF